jgi:sugar phosphate isomerase/epimerase
MLLGYNTNGLPAMDAPAAIGRLAEIGYQSVALTLDQHLLNPFAADFDAQLSAVKTTLDRLGMRSVIEAGARFLLNPDVKHEPTLVSADASGRKRRIEFLQRAIDVAAALGADCVSFWSGAIRDGADEQAVWDRLTTGLATVIDYADSKYVAIGFEPEPDMFIDTMSRYRDLLDRLAPRSMKLTLDVGHLHCLGEIPIANQIDVWKEDIVNIHIEDMRQGQHEHLMFGEGEIDFPPILAALAHAGYRGCVNVELSRHSHEGIAAATRAFHFLKPLMGA